MYILRDFCNIFGPQACRSLLLFGDSRMRKIWGLGYLLVGSRVEGAVSRMQTKQRSPRQRQTGFWLSSREEIASKTKTFWDILRDHRPLHTSAQYVCQGYNEVGQFTYLFFNNFNVVFCSVPQCLLRRRYTSQSFSVLSSSFGIVLNTSSEHVLHRSKPFSVAQYFCKAVALFLLSL